MITMQEPGICVTCDGCGNAIENFRMGHVVTIPKPPQFLVYCDDCWTPTLGPDPRLDEVIWQLAAKALADIMQRDNEYQSDLPPVKLVLRDNICMTDTTCDICGNVHTPNRGFVVWALDGNPVCGSCAREYNYPLWVLSQLEVEAEDIVQGSHGEAPADVQF